jgi:hypothetical protein
MTRNAGTLDTETAAIQIQIKPSPTDNFDDCHPVVLQIPFNTTIKGQSKHNFYGVSNF